MIGPANLKKAMTLCLDLIDNLDNTAVYEQWIETLPKLCYELNFISNTAGENSQETILQEVVYERVNQMIERKQER